MDHSDRDTGKRVRSVWVAAAVLIAAGLAQACSSKGGGDTAARDSCEATAGVGNCVQRDGNWVPIGSRNGTTSSSTTRAPSTTAPTTTAPPTSPPTAPPPTAPPTAPPVSRPADVRGEPAGLFCRDLKAKGYSYSAAVDYWRAHGQPNQMDADRNGIPCETVFVRSDVASYWGVQPASPPPGGLARNLSCRQLYDAGTSYPLAVAYWYGQGVPANMDADHNGIPCETVYPASVVNAYWY